MTEIHIGRITIYIDTNKAGQKSFYSDAYSMDVCEEDFNRVVAALRSAQSDEDRDADSNIKDFHRWRESVRGRR